MPRGLQAPRPRGNCYARRASSTARPCVQRRNSDGMAFAEKAGKGKPMGPAIALRLRQHLTLTPQVQQALRLLQMSALEFSQEMEQAVAANPFLEENPDAPAPAGGDKPVEELVLP